MPFFQLVDELSNNRKIKALLDPTLDGDMSGCAAFTVWSISGTTSQAAGSDGVVKRADVARILLDSRMSLDAATMLVEVGLWHAPGHECPRCPPVADGTFLFHDWFDLRYDTGAAVRLKRRKAAELKDAKIVAAVWARDCIDPNVPAKQMAAQCRYCGTVVKRMDNKSGVKPNLEHVDPSVTNGARNIVIACQPCNSSKGNRTPKAAGMELRPAPRTVAEQHTQVVVSPPRSDDGLVSSPRSDAGLSSTGSSREGVLAGRDVDEAVLAGRDDAGTRSAAQDRSPRPQVADAPATAEPGSPGQPVDGTRHDSGDAPATTGRMSDRAEDPDQTAIKPDQPENQLSDTVLGHVRAHVRQAGSGQGEVLGRGLGEGHSSRSPDHHPSGDTARKRGRRRSRGRSRSSTKQTSPDQSPDRPVNPFPPRPVTTAQILDPSMDAGAAPDIEVPARFGSPWFGWRGPASTVTETICEIHGQHEPCSTCKTSEE